MARTVLFDAIAVELISTRLVYSLMADPSLNAISVLTQMKVVYATKEKVAATI
jgi:hypothetical protein